MIAVEILVDHHEHAGKPVPRGSVIEVTPRTARRLVNMRQGREIEAAEAENNNNKELQNV